MEKNVKNAFEMYAKNAKFEIVETSENVVMYAYINEDNVREMRINSYHGNDRSKYFAKVSEVGNKQYHGGIEIETAFDLSTGKPLILKSDFIFGIEHDGSINVQNCTSCEFITNVIDLRSFLLSKYFTQFQNLLEKSKYFKSLYSFQGKTATAVHLHMNSELCEKNSFEIVKNLSKYITNYDKLKEDFGRSWGYTHYTSSNFDLSTDPKFRNIREKSHELIALKTKDEKQKKASEILHNCENRRFFMEIDNDTWEARAGLWSKRHNRLKRSAIALFNLFVADKDKITLPKIKTDNEV